MGCCVPLVLRDLSKGGQRNLPSVASRCGSLLLSLSADVRSFDDVIAFEGPPVQTDSQKRTPLYRRRRKLWLFSPKKLAAGKEEKVQKAAAAIMQDETTTVAVPLVPLVTVMAA